MVITGINDNDNMMLVEVYVVNFAMTKVVFTIQGGGGVDREAWPTYCDRSNF